jgi:hypothetical protein
VDMIAVAPTQLSQVIAQATLLGAVASEKEK